MKLSLIAAFVAFAGAGPAPSADASPESPEAAAPVPEPAAPTGASGGFDQDPATGGVTEQRPAFAPVESGGPAEARPDDAASPSRVPAAPPPAAHSDEGSTAPPSSTASPGAGAMGTAAMAPLPSPAPPVDPSSIAKGPWRGKGYLRLRVYANGAVGGEQPARSNVVAFGGEAEIGWRINNWASLGFGLGGNPHRRIERLVLIDGETFRELADASLMNWDFVVARFFVPLERRVQPFVDVSGGLSVLGPLPGESRRAGGQGRASIGMDVWVSRNLSLECALGYRLNAMDESVGHALFGRFGLGIHW